MAKNCVIFSRNNQVYYGPTPKPPPLSYKYAVGEGEIYKKSGVCFTTNTTQSKQLKDVRPRELSYAEDESVQTSRPIPQAPDLHSLSVVQCRRFRHWPTLGRFRPRKHMQRAQGQRHRIYHQGIT